MADGLTAAWGHGAASSIQLLRQVQPSPCWARVQQMPRCWVGAETSGGWNWANKAFFFFWGWGEPYSGRWWGKADWNMRPLPPLTPFTGRWLHGDRNTSTTHGLNCSFPRSTSRRRSRSLVHPQQEGKGRCFRYGRFPLSPGLEGEMSVGSVWCVGQTHPSSCASSEGKINSASFAWLEGMVLLSSRGNFYP